MSTTTVTMPEQDLEYLQRLAREEGLSLDEYLVKQSRWLRQFQERSLHPDVIRATAVIKGDIDGRKEYLEAMERKHA